jgi:hypothetical protein
MEKERDRKKWADIDASESIEELLNPEAIGRLEEDVDAFTRSARR